MNVYCTQKGGIMMHKKLAIKATRVEIESVMKRPFVYPKLHNPNSLIDGSEETLLPVVVMQAPEEITFAIWGFLPKDFHDDWSDFQEVFQTLHMTINDLENNVMANEAFRNERCLIIVTGFFIYHMHKGSLYPYYVYAENQKPFCLAGLYSVLQDGFITTTMLTTDSENSMKKIQNIETQMPIPIGPQLYNSWLADDIELDELKHILNSTDQVTLKAHPIAKDFFKNKIMYEGSLDPVYYEDIPTW